MSAKMLVCMLILKRVSGVKKILMTMEYLCVKTTSSFALHMHMRSCLRKEIIHRTRLRLAKRVICSRSRYRLTALD